MLFPSLPYMATVVVLVLATIVMASAANEETDATLAFDYDLGLAPKRAFMGMRGKKSYGIQNEDELEEVLKHLDSEFPKRSSAFVGMRGKKAFHGMRGKKSFYENSNPDASQQHQQWVRWSDYLPILQYRNQKMRRAGPSGFVGMRG